MTDLRKAAEMALEALENIDRWLPTIGQRGLRDYEADAIQALRQALAQPKREWVGLTEAERIDIIDAEIMAPDTEHFALAQSIEAKLKEKNT